VQHTAAGLIVAWVDLSVALNITSLSFYRRLLHSSFSELRVASAAVIKTFVSKGIKDPREKLEVYKALDVVSMLDPLLQTDDEAFRAAIGSILAPFGQDLIAIFDDVSDGLLASR
jgi:exportin-T